MPFAGGSIHKKLAAEVCQGRHSMAAEVAKNFSLEEEAALKGVAMAQVKCGMCQVLHTLVS